MNAETKIFQTVINISKIKAKSRKTGTKINYNKAKISKQ